MTSKQVDDAAKEADREPRSQRGSAQNTHLTDKSRTGTPLPINRSGPPKR